MKSLYLKDILHIIGGKVAKGSVETVIYYATVKPRMMRNESLFFDRYRGKYYDPEDFLEYDKPVIVTENPSNFKVLGDGATIIEVDDIDKAFWNFAKYYRELFKVPIVGVTGTCGKTTTKEMIKHILSKDHSVCSTYKSQNASYLDLHYLVKIDEKTDFGVFEMGVLWPGDLTDSCRVFMPKIRIILNIGVYHLTGCKTPKEYLKAKSEMLEGIEDTDGTLILNIDDKNINKIDVSKAKNIVYFGIKKEADFKAVDIKYGNNGMNFNLVYRDKEYRAFIPGFGKHSVYNALAAIAAVYNLGISIEDAIRRLEGFKHIIEHMEINTGAGGAIVFDDTWSSAPPSVMAALEVLEGISNNKKKIVLLGIMPLLGENEYALEEYRKVGEKVAKMGIDTVIVVGDEAREIGNRALELGMKEEKVYFCSDGNEVYDIVKPFLNEDSIILLKITHRQMTDPSFRNFKSKLIPKNR